MADSPQPPESLEGSERQSSHIQLWLIVLAVLVLGAVVEVITYGYLERPGWIGSAGKQFWDYLELLIVPAAIAVGVAVINLMQSERHRQADRAHEERENKAEETRKEREIAVASQHAQDATLQAYLAQMGQLLLDRERPLRLSKEGDEVQSFARVWTVAALRSFDANHNGIVLRFLQESGLINQESPVISLQDADLSQVNLERMTLGNVSLSDAKLRQANFEEAVLWSLSLHEVDLTEANLKKVVIYGNVDLSGSILERADLRGAELIGLKTASGTNLDLGSANLERADLREAVLGGDYYGRDLRFFRSTIASGQAFTGDLFKGVNLDNANLKEANLQRAQLTHEQLAQCRSLRGATMPNGQKYEEWLKTPVGQQWHEDYKEAGSGDNMENRGPS